jgi:hypothetical protein
MHPLVGFDTFLAACAAIQIQVSRRSFGQAESIMGAFPIAEKIRRLSFPVRLGENWITIHKRRPLFR